MSDDPRIAQLANSLLPLVSKVRTDVTAVRDADGTQAWTQQRLTTERIRAHLNGGPARGVCPIKAGESTTMVAVLDFDSHGGEVSWVEMSAKVSAVVDALEMIGMQPILFRSGGGKGVHLYLLWDSPQDAYSVRMMLIEALSVAGLKSGAKGLVHGEVEIFPKQDSVAADGYGNQFILPGSRASTPLDLRQEEDS
jgi:hypothetical protein